jgi:hypothetical protein
MPRYEYQCQCGATKLGQLISSFLTQTSRKA